MTDFSKPSVCPRGLLLVTFFVAIGCGRAAEVTGKATLNGKPITSGSVVILATDSLTYSGELDGQGVYRILNVPRGNAKVSIVSPDPGALIKAGKNLSQRVKTAAMPVATPQSWFPIPAHYGDFEKSELRLEVLGGANTFDLPLVGAPKKK